METVYCELKYSGLGIAFLLVAAGCTIALALALPWAIPWRMLLVGWIGGGSFVACRALAAVRSLRLDRSGVIVLVRRNGSSVSGTVRDGSFVAPWLTILRWRPQGGRWDRSLVLLPDAADAEAMRKIRVILRWA